ncbi:hypothetical protein CDL15_Pgr026219 [Punica granatum]|uniref:Uncharacterized protein n=1 Tax=Punica granatum TaxID=22663 RepID=A0A218VRB5_PUNGR|nr:hypothetical protein CDL15_Pgr026219 [Punica granatum]
MNYKEETGATKGRKRGDQRKQTSNEPQSSRNWHCSTIYRRITGAPKGIQYGVLKIPYDTKMTNGTSERISELSCLSRGTPEHLQMPS